MKCGGWGTHTIPHNARNMLVGIPRKYNPHVNETMLNLCQSEDSRGREKEIKKSVEKYMSKAHYRVSV